MDLPKQVFVFGNSDLAMDSLPLRLLPDLQTAFPSCTFTTLDPNEDWDVPEHMIIIDTVVNINEPAVFTDLSQFMSAPRISCHDYDAYAGLMLLKKLGKLDTVTILGLPPGAAENTAIAWLASKLSRLSEKGY